VWEPFSAAAADDCRVERNLYKNVIGNRILFEEIHHGLELAFRYRWTGSDELGLVRTATLQNQGDGAVSIEVLDGLRNVMPYGVSLALQQRASCLADAYKRCDCDPETRAGIFSLTSAIVDLPEAAEVLRANVVWCHGLPGFEVCLSTDAVAAFRRGEAVAGDRVLTGRRGSYLVVATVELDGRREARAGSTAARATARGTATTGRTAAADAGRRATTSARWHLVADVGRSHAQLATLRARLLDGGDLDEEIERSLETSSEGLRRIVGSADGRQLTGQPTADAHHFANVLFNSMRGGVFARNHEVPVADFIDFLRTRQRATVDRHRALLESLPPEIPFPDLLGATRRAGDPDLERLAHEYLPLHFGRRHGDPSRPWNVFTIRARRPDGALALRYEGNWRDIFQNWEALSLSFPAFLPGIIAKFVNASTVDGFNPYRITREGIDWETVDPEDPWSCIGYWGDHQIIYLLKLLESVRRFSPGTLEKSLVRQIYCYADVPYRLKSYREMLRDPRATVDYDTDLAGRIEERVKAVGTDGKLLQDADGRVYHVSLLEKLLVPALSKLSNLIPEGGIWLNTQRPEWNDANNALVGNGISVVTLCYLRRYLRFLADLLDGLEASSVPISVEVGAWCRRLRSTLDEHRTLLAAGAMHDRERKRLVDAAGEAFEAYRSRVYAGGFSGKEELSISVVAALCDTALDCLDHAIDANRRPDGLYHSYNLIDLESDERSVSVQPLYEMLEGQVAVLSSGVLEAPAAAELIRGLFESRIYRADQRSFLLYPARELPSFLERNVIAEDRVAAIPLLRELLAAGDVSLVECDALGACHFQADLGNARDVAAVLDRLATVERWKDAVTRDRQAVLELYEAVFRHRSFTGRSGSMYGYEGLGCIYWHMVAKLLLAVQEVVLRAARSKQPTSVLEPLMRDYYRIRAGLGFEKTVVEYGAFPTDPYSHTPPHAGARQPGMTGQVKEEILTRFGELGLEIEAGGVRFRPLLLRRIDFRVEPGELRFHDVDGEPRTIDVPAGALAFTFCQVPIVYRLTRQEAWVRVTTQDGASSEHAGDRLDPGLSQALFARTGHIARIDVGVTEQSLYRF
jgi:hypothetical protein